MTKTLREKYEEWLKRADYHRSYESIFTFFESEIEEAKKQYSHELTVHINERELQYAKQLKRDRLEVLDKCVLEEKEKLWQNSSGYNSEVKGWNDYRSKILEIKKELSI